MNSDPTQTALLDGLTKIGDLLRTMSLRQEALIAAINKQTSVVDTTNELISRLIAWSDDASPPGDG
jgi:hypothetical protein